MLALPIYHSRVNIACSAALRFIPLLTKSFLQPWKATAMVCFQFHHFFFSTKVTRLTANQQNPLKTCSRFKQHKIHQQEAHSWCFMLLCVSKKRLLTVVQWDSSHKTQKPIYSPVCLYSLAVFILTLLWTITKRGEAFVEEVHVQNQITSWKTCGSDVEVMWQGDANFQVGL